MSHVISALLVAHAATPPLKVAVDGGRITGRLDRSLVVFQGVRYAAPPVADLRWRAPQAVMPWSATGAT